MKCPNPNCTCDLILDNSIKEWKCPTCHFHTRIPIPGLEKDIQKLQNPSSQIVKYLQGRFEIWQRLNPQPIPPEEEDETPFVSIESDNSANVGQYTLDWGRNHPGHIVYLIDFSGSMKIGNKMKMVENAFKELSQYLFSQCIEKVETDDGDIVELRKNRISIKILGYNDSVKTLFEGSVLELNDKLSAGNRNDSIFKKLGCEMPTGIWTNTEKAFIAAKEDIENWIEQQEGKCIQQPAPVVIHITDGLPEEVDPMDSKIKIQASKTIRKTLEAADDIKKISVRDGNALLFNIHITGNKKEETLSFPKVSPPESDIRRKFLFDASSVIPKSYLKRAPKDLKIEEGCRFMVSNESDETKLVELIKFGSMPPGDHE